MKNRILAVCDPEEAYASRLMEYLNEKQVSPFYVRAFTSKEALKDYAKEEDVEVVLISSDLAEDETDDELRELGIGKRILLTQGRVPAELEGEPAVYKYQSAEKIIREALFFYAEEAQPYLQAALLKEEVRLYGVYSPIHRIGKTTFALALGSVCAAKKKTLYLNLEPCSGFEEMLGMDCQTGGKAHRSYGQPWNLGDLLYYLRKGKQGFLYKLKSVTQSLGELDFVLPVSSGEDLLTMTEAEWEELLERLITDAGYECLVIDFSDCVQGLPTLLDKCSKVYMPVSEDRISQAKIKQFMDVLERKKCESLRTSICEINLPRIWEMDGTNGLDGIPEQLYRFVEAQEEG